MATRGKVRSLVTRPIQSSDLAFEVAGVIEWQNQGLKLGNRIRPEDILRTDSLAKSLMQRGADDFSSVRFGSDAINSEFGVKSLCRLRNYQEAVGLDQSIAQRDTQFLRVFRQATRVGDAIKAASESAYNRIRKIKEASQERFNAIDAAYAGEADVSWRGVKKSVESLQRTEGAITSDLFITPMGMMTDRYEVTAKGEGGSSTQVNPEVKSTPVAWRPSANGFQKVDAGLIKEIRAAEPAFLAQRNVTLENQSVRRTASQNAEFWYPRLDNVIEFESGQIATEQEELTNLLSVISAEKVSDVILRERDLIEKEVYKNQMRLLTTFLFAPFSGVVTAVYKDVGEYVQPGEPVLRIDNDARLLLIGQIQLRGAPVLNSQVTIIARNLFETTAKPRSIPATLVSIRGHESDDDEWELVFEMANTAPQLPLNFSFDRDTTTIEFP